MMDTDRRITLEHFRAFVTVVECAGFAAAAQRMGRTQSALTHQIRGLESLLGERLLNRSQGHFLGLTEQGAHLLPHAHRVLGSVASACQAATRPLLSGRVRLGVVEDFDMQGLIDLIAGFKALHTDAEISTVSDLSARLQARLQRGEIDIALIKQIALPGHAPSPRALRAEPLQWVASQDCCPPQPHQSVPLAVLHEGCVYRQWMLDHLTRLGVNWHIAYTSYSYPNVRAAVQAGLGLSVMPQRWIPEPGLQRERLFGNLALPELGWSELVLHTGSQRASPIVAAFQQELARTLTGAG